MFPGSPGKHLSSVTWSFLQKVQELYQNPLSPWLTLMLQTSLGRLINEQLILMAQSLTE